MQQFVVTKKIVWNAPYMILPEGSVRVRGLQVREGSVLWFTMYCLEVDFYRNNIHVRIPILLLALHFWDIPD